MGMRPMHGTCYNQACMHDPAQMDGLACVAQTLCTHSFSPFLPKLPSTSKCTFCLAAIFMSCMPVVRPSPFSLQFHSIGTRALSAISCSPERAVLQFVKEDLEHVNLCTKCRTAQLTAWERNMANFAFIHTVYRYLVVGFEVLW